MTRSGSCSARRRAAAVARPAKDRAWPGRAVAAVLLLLAAAAPAAAQRQPVPEFTRQGLLVANFVPGASADTALSDRVAAELRDRLADILDKREVGVTQTNEVRNKLRLAGFEERGSLPMATTVQLGRIFRADELVLGTVERRAEGLHASAELVLMRDTRMRQPLPPATGATTRELVDALARSVAAARRQLAPQRRCENLLREGRNNDAVRAAREGIAAYPASALARTCLVMALRAGRAPAATMLAAAQELLAQDSMSAHGLEAAGIALDSLRRRPEAAAMWLRLAHTDTANLELTERVLWALHENENSRAAEPLGVRVSDAHPDSVRLLHLKWRITHANESWAEAVKAGEALLVRHPVVSSDSGFVARLVEAYQGNGQPYLALAAAARGVATISSGRLYAVYAQLVLAEADTVLPHGLALYPRSADMLALNARTLRAQGQIAEALELTRLAVEIDPTLPGGQLVIAQAEFDLGQPDSALRTLRRIVEGPATMVAALDAAPPADSASGPTPQPAARGGTTTWTPPDDSVVTAVAQFALAKGNTLLRAANATKTLDGFELTLRYLALGDSLRPSAQGAFLRGVAALGVASAAVTESVDMPPSSGGCTLIRTAAAQLPVARAGLEQGRELAAEASRQYLVLLDQLASYVGGQLAGTCANVPDAPAAPPTGTTVTPVIPPDPVAAPPAA